MIVGSIYVAVNYQQTELKSLGTEFSLPLIIGQHILSSNRKHFVLSLQEEVLFDMAAVDCRYSHVLISIMSTLVER